MVQGGPGVLPDSSLVALPRMVRSSQARRPGLQRRLTRRLLHFQDQVRNTLTHTPAKVGMGQSPELLILIGTDDMPSVSLQHVIPSSLAGEHITGLSEKEKISVLTYCRGYPATTH